jgi:hypothetical protein
MYCVSQRLLRNIHGSQKLLRQHFTWVSGFSVARYAYHNISLMVVSYFHFGWSCNSPLETNSKLLVNSNAVLTPSLSRQGFQTITGRYFQFFNGFNGIQLIKFPCGNSPNRLRTRFSGNFRCLAVKNILCRFILKRFNHTIMLSRLSCYLKRRAYLLLGYFNGAARSGPGALVSVPGKTVAVKTYTKFSN